MGEQRYDFKLYYTYNTNFSANILLTFLPKV